MARPKGPCDPSALVRGLVLKITKTYKFSVRATVASGEGELAKSKVLVEVGQGFSEQGVVPARRERYIERPRIWEGKTSLDNGLRGWKHLLVVFRLLFCYRLQTIPSPTSPESGTRNPQQVNVE